MAAGQSEEAIMEVAIEAGASDVCIDQDQVEVIVPVEAYHSVLSALHDAGLTVEESQLTMRAQTMVPINDEAAQTLIKLIDMLEDLDDVQEVYTNAEFSSHVLESIN